jgi:phospholipid transport system transporter-binding protein
MANAQASLAACTAAIEAGEASLSLDGLAHSDSSAVAVLVAARRSAQQRGRALALTGVPDTVRSLAKLYGVEELVGP